MSWFTKLIGIDKVVDRVVNKEIDNRLKSLDVDPFNNAIMHYQEQENKVWALASPLSLLEFYSIKHQPSQFSNERYLFWNWVAGAKVPKMHYPAPETLINNMKSLLFGKELDMYYDTGNEAKDNPLNERLNDMIRDVGLYELLQEASMFETYSGTIGFKLVVDSEVHNKPIIQVYPKERLELTTKHKKVIEVVFKDYYKKNNRTYTLRSVYGKGFIKYRLYNDKGDIVPLTTLIETSDLEDLKFNTDKLLAVYKKNRTNSNQFIDSPYGGSDFEGNIDTFHAMDEIYSTMMSTIRRSRPITTINEELLPAKPDGTKEDVPKEYELDSVIIRSTDSAKNTEDKIYRDIPKLDLTPYLDSLTALEKSVNRNVGLSYVSVGLESVSANISGASLVEKKEQTETVYNNKSKLWQIALRGLIDLYFSFEDIMTKTPIGDYTEGLNVEFPEFAGATFDEKVESARKAIEASVWDIRTATEYVNLGKAEETIHDIVLNSKIEKGIPILQEDMSDDR